MSISIVVVSKPVSVNNAKGAVGRKRKADLQLLLQNEVRRRFPGLQQMSPPLYARLIWFHNNQPGDPDNIVKPILDALNTVVYDDDRAVRKVVSERIDLTRNFTFPTDPSASDVYDELIELIGQGHDHILYVEIGEIVSEQQIFLGPIQ